MNQITVGRNSQSSIVVSSQYTTVSGNHATITCENGEYTIEDHSTNGTYINGSRLHNASCQIRPNDEITLGHHYLLNFNEVRALLDDQQQTVRRNTPATERVQPIQGQNQNPQVNINQELKPECYGRFNWGAFWLTWIWGIGNGVGIALLCLIPFVNIVMQFILGFKANEWAWEKQKHYKTPEEFDRSQQSWTTAGWVVFVISFLIGIALGIVG